MLRRLGATSAKKGLQVFPTFLADVLALFVDHALKVETPRFHSHSRVKSMVSYSVPRRFSFKGLFHALFHAVSIRWSYSTLPAEQRSIGW
jgi:hypothetical protein